MSGLARWLRAAMPTVSEGQNGFVITERFEGSVTLSGDEEALSKDVKQDDDKVPVGRWCVVANIIDECEFGEQHTLLKGSKHFSPGTKVYCGSCRGSGWDRTGVLGRHRGSRRLTYVYIHHKYLHNYRAVLEYSPYVQRLLGKHWISVGGFTDAGHKEALDYAEYWNDRSVNDGIQQIIKRYTRDNFQIRSEVEGDIEAISRVIQAAFGGNARSDHREQLIVDALRAAGALTISLVADRAGDVVGHVAFSPVTIASADGDISGWYGLGPICVAPEHQGRGVGRALMNEGLLRLRAVRAAGCVLVGDPAFYCRFGFANRPELTLAGVPPENFLIRLLRPGKPPRGEVRFHPAFETTA